MISVLASAESDQRRVAVVAGDGRLLGHVEGPAAEAAKQQVRQRPAIILRVFIFNRVPAMPENLFGERRDDRPQLVGDGAGGVAVVREHDGRVTAPEEHV